jgi:hypothetical protein
MLLGFMKKEVCQLIAQIDSFKTLKDGGGKLTLAFGLDSLEELKKLLEWSARGEQLFAVVITPINNAGD